MSFSNKKKKRRTKRMVIHKHPTMLIPFPDQRLIKVISKLLVLLKKE